MRIIFFPIEAGVAHLTRSFAIAHELAKKKGVRVIFALNRSKQSLVKDKNILKIDVKEFFGDEKDVKKTKDPDYLKSFVQEETRLIEKYQPDLVVVDGRLSALISAKKMGVPFVFLSNTDALTSKIYLPNLGLFPLFDKLLNPVFQFLVLRFKNTYLTALAQAAKKFGTNLTKDDFYNMTYIVPEPVEYLPPKAQKDNVYYTGPVWWKGFEERSPNWLKDIKPDGRTIYLTFGGTGYDPKKLVSLSQELVRAGYRVIVNSSNIANPKDFKKLPNLYVERYLPGFEVCKKVDLVICHGGLGTLSQALVSGKPTISIPFNPDQYVHGFRFQELGLGICVAKINLLKMVTLDWADFQSLGREVSIKDILKTTSYVLSNPEKFQDSINKFRKIFTRQNGAKEAAALIEKLC